MKLRQFIFSLAIGSAVYANTDGLQTYIGPEFYHVHRSKELGAEQNGWLCGGRIGFDYLKRFNFYAGADGLYASGSLNGRSGNDLRIKSTLTDKNVEARFGYTFQCKEGWRFGLTPFVGWGYFWETNRFRHPSPQKVTFDNHMTYIPVGFIAQMQPTDLLTIQLRFKARYLYRGHIKAHDKDEDIGKFKLHYQERLHYRVDLPLIYEWCLCEHRFYTSVDPFYEVRNYGRLAGYPFDFEATTFRIYGFNLSYVQIF